MVHLPSKGTLTSKKKNKQPERKYNNDKCKTEQTTKSNF